jgi:sodium-dependent dicarboxylate transporter 2/3/5
MLLGVPIVALFLPLAWWWLTRNLGEVSLGNGGREELRAQRASLGPMSRDEKLATALFAAAALGWLFRRSIEIGPVSIPGWADLLGRGGDIHDAVVAVGVALAAFFLPSGVRPGERLLTWPEARRISWGLLLLFGGGLSLARGFQVSGLSTAIGEVFGALSGAPLVLIVLSITLGVIFLTELTSNTATTTVMMPILAALAAAIGASPMHIMLPAALAASCAFMLPVATPPNAVVFSAGHVQLRDMMRAGLFLNLVGTLIITALVMLLGSALPSPGGG